MTLFEKFLMALYKSRIFEDYFYFGIVGKSARKILAKIGHKKEPIARLITPDELENIPTGRILWVDNRSSDGELYETMPVVFWGVVASVENGKGITAHIDLGDIKLPLSQYGTWGYVYWTSRPTDEQRKLVNWNEWNKESW